MDIASKLPQLGVSIFSTMSQLAAEHKALNLSQGFPDFQVSQELVDRIYFYMSEGKNQYAPSPGLPHLRQVITKMNEALYDHKANSSNEVTVFTGATEALFTTFSVLVAKGDEVILFDPAYDSYDPVIRLNGGTPVHIELDFPAFTIPWDQVRKKLTPKTKAIVINNPHNPTGAVLSEEDLRELEQIARGNDLFVISDEVYHNMIFDNQPHQSVLCYPELAKRSVAIFSFGKTLHATGWKVGYACAPARLTKELLKIHQLLTFSVNTPVQHALADFISDSANYTYISRFFQQKRDTFLKFLSDTNFKPIASKGTYFQLLSYKGLSEKGDMDMARYLTTEKGIASIPVSVFYDQKTDNKVLRFCFAKEDNTLLEAAKLLKEAS